MLRFHYTYIIMALGFILTGYYMNLIVFTTLIIAHELGHYIVAKLQHLNVKNITIYPYGGLTKLEELINQDINKELKVAIAGMIFQTIFYILIIYLYKHNFIREYTYDLYTSYHKELIMFNILPIYPLDGSKIISHLLEKIIPYNLVNKITIFISILTIIILLSFNIYQNNYSYILIISILLEHIYKFYKNLNYLYYRFLLERYLYKIKYNQNKIITNPKKMYKNKTHLIKKIMKYQKESDFLNNLFDLKKKIW